MTVMGPGGQQVQTAIDVGFGANLMGGLFGKLGEGVQVGT
jgi:hypothetical protein